MMTIDQKLNDLGYTLPTPAAPAASYVPVRQSGKLLYVSGQISADADGVVKGRLGDGTDVAAGQKAAELCAVSVLAQVNQVTALANIKAIQKLMGDKGKHARAAFGVASLPLGAAVEIDAIIEIE
jgi:enamine deaminase RidA (YjgF/YER057c/UK114 family)